MGRTLPLVMLSVVLALALALPAGASEAEEHSDEGEKKTEGSDPSAKAAAPPAATAPVDAAPVAPPAEADEKKTEAPAPLDPAILEALRAEFTDQHLDYTARPDPSESAAFEAYLREEFDYYQNVGYGIVLGVIPAIFAASLGVGLGYCADGMDGESCRAAAMGGGVPVIVAVAILGGTFITTYGMKLDKLDKILGGVSAGPDSAALMPRLAPLLDARGRPGGVTAGLRF